MSNCYGVSFCVWNVLQGLDGRSSQTITVKQACTLLKSGESNAKMHIGMRIDNTSGHAFVLQCSQKRPWRWSVFHSYQSQFHLRRQRLTKAELHSLAQGLCRFAPASIWRALRLTQIAGTLPIISVEIIAKSNTRFTTLTPAHKSSGEIRALWAVCLITFALFCILLCLAYQEGVAVGRQIVSCRP